MTPRRHWMEVTQTASGFTRMRCYLCDEDFYLTAANGDPLTFTTRTMLEPAEALAAVIEHLTKDRPEGQDADHIAAAQMLTGLANNIEPGLKVLAENLPNVGISLYDLREEP